MNYSAFAANLQLTYAPISAHDFAVLKTEAAFRQSVTDAMLYAICQRQMLSFENVTPTPDGKELLFEIHMQNSSHQLSCRLPLHQATLDAGEGLQAHFGFYEEDDRSVIPPYKGVNGIQFYTEKGDFVLWLSPDKFLHHYWSNLLEASVEGDLREFTKFRVLYVGKATDQLAIDRLTGHYTLQDILSLEKALVKGTPSAHEIMLLLFEVGAGDYIATLAGGDDAALDRAFGDNLPDKKTVALDAEKAFVKLLQPNYNHHTKRFPNYPKSTDGLYQYAFDKFTYQVKEDITLFLNEVVVQGSVNGQEVDLIVVDANKTVEIVQLY
jgi:hypothetical protein